MSMVECMHGVAGHIDNILVELPHHLKTDDKKIVNEMLQVYYAEKDKKTVVFDPVFVSKNRWKST